MAASPVNHDDASSPVAADVQAGDGRALRIDTTDGIALSIRHYAPQRSDDVPPRAAIFLCATGATQARFAAFAQYLAARGWHAVTFDYRSIGESAVSVDALDKVSMRAWAREDLSAVIDWTTRTLGDPAIALVTHSIGGQLVPHARNADRVRAMLAVAVQKGWYRLWPTWRRHAVFAFFRFYVPFFLRLRGHVPLRMVGLDPLERGVAEDYARWTLRPDYLDEQGASMHEAFARFRAPILSLSFEDDQTYAPRPTVERLFEAFYRNAPVLRAHVDPARMGLSGLGHSGFFDPAVCPPAFWDEAEGWLRATVTGAAPMAYPFRSLPAMPLRRGVDADAQADDDTGRALPQSTPA